ncbi:CHAT domain-containing tetratricopeptide repeat protein, partial [Dehalococcoidia bacterium]|nr:CHAT domain-containing tetratricopeptide repeat protein [Dehalococcoidia bacterium]
MTTLLEGFPEGEDFEEWDRANKSGEICFNEENFEKASQDYRNAAELSRTFPPRLNHLKSNSWTALGRSLMAQEQYGEAVIAYQTAILFGYGQPDLGMLWGFLGRALYLDDKPTESQEAFLQAVRIDPDDWGSWTEAGFSLDREEKWPESEIAYGEAIRVDPSNEWAWRGLGFSRSRQDEWHHAIEAYQRALQIDPGHPESWAALSICLAHLKRNEESREAILRAVEIHPDGLGPELYLLGMLLHDQGEYLKCIEIFRLMNTGVHNPSFHWDAWMRIAEAQIQVKRPALDVIASYKEMSLAIENLRQHETDWDERNEQTGEASQALKEAANYSSIHQFNEDALRFSVQSKTRALLDLIGFVPTSKTKDNFRNILSKADFEEFLSLERKRQDHEQKTRELLSFEFEQTLNRSSQGRGLFVRAPITKTELESMAQDVRACSEHFASKILPKYPQFSDPSSTRFDFQINDLCQALKPGEAVLDLVGDPEFFLSFLVTPKGLVGSHRLINKIEDWWTEIFSILLLGENSRADGIKRDLTPETLARWGELLYGPFIDDLKDIKRLWISPNSLLTQLPFNAIPFPDCVEREVAIIPSAASLTRPAPKGPRPKPRFTLGVVAADALEQAPLNLQSEEVRHLRNTVKSAKHRWELAGDRDGEEPTLANIRGKRGLTRCLVFSCHGGDSSQSWGSLYLGGPNNPEIVTGKELVYGRLSGDQHNMEADVVITS